MKQKTEQWSSKLGFILSSAGAAIGLGAIWKFPYVTGMSGGGAFFLIFVLFTVLIGLPLLLAEFIIGRGSGKEAISAYKKLAPKSVSIWIGRLGVVGCFLLLSFYSVVGGWVLIYSSMSVLGKIIAPQVEYGALFVTVIGTPWITLICLLIFNLATSIDDTVGVHEVIVN